VPIKIENAKAPFLSSLTLLRQIPNPTSLSPLFQVLWVIKTSWTRNINELAMSLFGEMNHG
jgi:hypothetical protein